MSKTRRRIKREAEERRRVKRANEIRIREAEELARYRSEEWRRSERRRNTKEFGVAALVCSIAGLLAGTLLYGAHRLCSAVFR